MERVSPDRIKAFRRRRKLTYGGRFIRDITRQLYEGYLRCFTKGYVQRADLRVGLRFHGMNIICQETLTRDLPSLGNLLLTIIKKTHYFSWIHVSSRLQRPEINKRSLNCPLKFLYRLSFANYE
jgi:hypothetical protein